ncbi:MAG: hypothetical protein ACLFWG_00165 [Longimicrobiales bacterium]
MFEGEMVRVTLEEAVGDCHARVEVEATGHSAVHPEKLADLAYGVWERLGGPPETEARVEEVGDDE